MEVNDRELLELAAKAAGIVTHWGDGWQSDMMFRSAPRPNSPLVTNIEWNPLTDDGDALRLAVKLDIFATPVFFHYRSLERFGRQDADDVTATRRAIVRAAAAIAQSFPATSSASSS